MAKFGSQVSDWAKKSERRMEAIFKESAQRLFEQAQTTVGNGGKLRIDTGFLRGSFSTSLEGVPQGPSRNPYASGSQQTDWNDVQTAVTINGAKLGNTIWGGWTANYARPREAKDGFMRSAAMNWPMIVSAVTVEAKARIP